MADCGDGVGNARNRGESDRRSGGECEDGGRWRYGDCYTVSAKEISVCGFVGLCKEFYLLLILAAAAVEKRAAMRLTRAKDCMF
jgi:hypothetical protein